MVLRFGITSAAKQKIVKNMKGNKGIPVGKATKETSAQSELVDPRKFAAFEARYNAQFTKRNLNTVHQLFGNAVAHYRGWFSNSKFIDSLGNNYIRYNAAFRTMGLRLDQKDPHLEFTVANSEAMQHSRTLSSSLEFDEKEMSFYGTPYEMRFMLGLQNLQATSLCLEQIRKIIPNFKLPESWQGRDRGTDSAQAVMPDETMASDWLNTDRLINIYDSEQESSFPDDMLHIPKFTQDGFVKKEIAYKNTFLKFVITRCEVLNAQKDANEGPITESNALIFDLAIQCKMTFPTNYILYATGVKNLADFIPLNGHTLIDENSQIVKKRGRKSRVDTPIQKLIDIGSIQKYNDELQAKYKLQFKPRVNEEGFCILPDGSVIYLPNNTDNTKLYSDHMRQAYDVEAKRIKMNYKAPEIKSIPLKVDWMNNIFSFTTEDCRMDTTNLEGAIPLDDVTIANYLSTPIVDYEQKYGTDLDKLILNVDTMLKLPPERSLYAEWSYMSAIKDFTVGRLFGMDFDDNDISNSSFYRDKIRVLVNKIRNIIPDFYKANTGMTMISRSESMFFLTLMGKYAAKSHEYYAIRRKSQEMSLSESQSVVPTELTLPNMPNLKSLLPQQASAAHTMDKGQYFVILDISAGGGKTLTIITDILQLKAKGKIKRACVICPTNLVKEFVNEINSKSGGRLNAFGIDNSTINKYINILNWDQDRFVARLRDAPENTIFVIGFSRLSNTLNPFTKERDSIIYGNSGEVAFYPMAQMLRAVGMDYIAIDEVQKTKNRKASVTKAVKVLSAESKYRRIASGTIVYNIASDVVSQTGILNPAILGTDKDFVDRFGLESTGGKVNIITLDQANAIDRVVSENAAKVTKRRPDWAPLLPKITSNIIMCSFTPKQKEYYDKLMEEKLRELQNNEKIRQLIDDADDPSKENELEAELERTLHSVELFINVPDKTETFRTQSGLTSADMISPKIRETMELLEMHFNGGNNTFYDAEKERVVTEKIPPTPGKVIIFSFNKEVSDHNAKWLSERPNGSPTKWADKIVHYRAGDSKALYEFVNDPKKTILVADENTLSEGFNLQVASRIIRIQTLWTPGKQEQSASRIMRPDVFNVYGRDNIYLNWLLVEQSIDVAKAARLMSKMINNYNLTEIQNKSWVSFSEKNNLTSLPLIRMSFKLIKDYKTQDDLFAYYSTYAKVQAWEESQFKIKRKELWNLVTEKTGVEPKNDQEFRLALVNLYKVKGDTEILPGSKRIFTALPVGSTPVDLRGLNLKALSIAKSSDEANSENDEDQDEDSIELVDNVVFDVGDLVQTEFGFGRITQINAKGKSVKVSIPGFRGGDAISISRMSVFKPAQPEDANKVEDWKNAVKKLERDVKRAGDKGILFTDDQDLSVFERSAKQEEPIIKVKQNNEVGKPRLAIKVPPKTKEEVKPAAPKQPKEEKYIPQKKPDGKLPLGVEVINGVWALRGTSPDDGDVQELAQELGWRYEASALEISFTNAKAAEYYLNAIALKFPLTPDSTLDKCERMIKLLKRRGTDGELEQTKKIDFAAEEIKNYFYTNKTAPKSENELKLYPAVMDGYFSLLFPIKTQPKARAKLKEIRRIAGMGQLSEIDPSYVKLFKTKQALMKELENLSKRYKIMGMADIRNRLKDPAFDKIVNKA